MAAIEPQKLWEQNDAILRNSAENPDEFPTRVVHPIENEGLMYVDHVNPNNERARLRREAEKAQIAAMDAAEIDPVVQQPEAPPVPGSTAPGTGPAIVPEGAPAGNGGGASATGEWKANA